MGKALAVQTARTGRSGIGGVLGRARAYGGKAKIHTTRAHRATVDSEPLRQRNHGMRFIVVV